MEQWAPLSLLHDLLITAQRVLQVADQPPGQPRNGPATVTVLESDQRSERPGCQCVCLEQGGCACG